MGRDSLTPAWHLRQQTLAWQRQLFRTDGKRQIRLVDTYNTVSKTKKKEKNVYNDVSTYVCLPIKKGNQLGQEEMSKEETYFPNPAEWMPASRTPIVY